MAKTTESFGGKQMERQSFREEEMPSSAFLLPGQRKFPYKVKVNGKWTMSCSRLRAAMSRAGQHGYGAVESKARELYNQNCK